MDLTKYRESDSEQKRTEDLLQLIRLLSNSEYNVLDVGARDGYFSKLLLEYFKNVTALDLERPDISHKNIYCIQGDVTNLSFSDNSFDFVFCTEVLEHIPANLLQKACSEVSRVSKKFVLIGVPYRQDIRCGRTTCYSCGKKNPPWGHVNNFDEKRLKDLFPLFNIDKISFVGKNDNGTNFLATFLMDLAGNPYGSYNQEETCIYCGKKLKRPPDRTILQKICSKAAFYINACQKPFLKPHPNWIHILFKKVK